MPPTNRLLPVSGCSDRFVYFFRAALLVLLLVFSHSVQAQTDTWGREFYLSLFPNPGPAVPPESPTTNPRAFLHFQALEPATVEVTYGTSLPEIYEVPAGGMTVELTKDWLDRITVAKRNSKNGRAAIHVISEAKIQVSISHHEGYSMDATTAMPVTSGGHHYIIPSWVDASRANIINTGGRTIVRIIPGLDPDGVPYGPEQAILLEEGEVYSIYGHNLSGYEIIASKDESQLTLPGPPGGGVIQNLDCDPLMVYTGNENGILSPCYSPSPKSHMLEALAPVVTAGKEYVLLPFYDRVNTNHRAVVVGLDKDSTLVERTIWYNETFSRTILDTLAKGEYAVYAAIHPMIIKAKKPIVAAQLEFNQDGCNLNWQPGEGYGGPMQITHPSFEQATEKAKIYVSEVLDIEKYYFNISIKTENVEKFSISPSVAGLEFTKLSDTGYSFANIQVSPNKQYTLEAPDGGFLVTEYGLGLGTSYGKNPYREINNLNFDMVIDDDEIGEVKDDACLNSVLAFDIDFLKPGLSDEYTKIEWDFGDGETFEGKSFEKTYAEAGIYRVSCVLSTDEDKCITTHTLYREIEIHEIIADRVEGPVSLCPYTDGIVYTLINEGGYIYDWEVEGGTIVGSSSGESIIVNWGETNENARVTVYVSNEFGCSVEPLFLDVALEPSDQLEPAPAYGHAEVCFTDMDYQIYYTPNINGADFEWIIEGGEVISGQGTHEVAVEWAEQEGSIYYILTLNECYGASPQLNVKVYDELMPEISLTDVQCNGNGDGMASITATGGKFPYTVTWSNGATGNATDQLEPGDYTVTVEDDLGCIKEMEFTIDEPAPLSADAFARKYCYGQPDGEVSIIVQGGVAPYSYHLYSSSSELNYDQQNTSSSFNNLYAGRYTLVVTDANQCTFNLTVDVEDPPELELKLLSNAPVCPGESNGSIVVKASGGVEPYSYTWDSNMAGPELNGVGEGDYSVQVTDANGCSATLNMTKVERYPKMLFPNSFSPNGDGVNDVFAPISPCIPDYDITIYDRWGRPVFEEIGAQGVWDGTFEGQEIPAEVYVYYVTYYVPTAGNDFQEKIRGQVRLIR